MNDQEDKRAADASPLSPGGGMSLKCDDIRELLTDYLTHELGDSRSALVREHLRKCEHCKAAAHEMAETFDLLRANKGASAPDRLSDAQRARVARALKHPIICWIEVNHSLVSAVIAVFLIMLLLASIVLITIMNRRPPETIIDIRMTPYESFELDKLEEREVPVGLSDMPEPELRPLESEEPTIPAVVTETAPPPETQAEVTRPATPAPRAKESHDEYSRRLGNIRRNRLFGVFLIAVASLLLGVGAFLVRRIWRRSDGLADGSVEEGPPPLG